jgi:hypothetical protein
MKRIKESIWEQEYRLKKEAKQLLTMLKEKENDKARNNK